MKKYTKIAVAVPVTLLGGPQYALAITPWRSVANGIPDLKVFIFSGTAQDKTTV